MSHRDDEPASPGNAKPTPPGTERPGLESETAENPLTLSRVLVAVDLSDRSDQVIREAKRIATPAGAEVMLAHVVCDLEDLLGAYVVQKPPPKLQGDLEIEGKARLRRLGQEYLDGGNQSREIVMTGEPWSEILGAAIRHRVDLIVMGAHDEDRAEHRILGSTLARVLRNSSCPVLVVPTD